MAAPIPEVELDGLADSYGGSWQNEVVASATRPPYQLAHGSKDDYYVPPDPSFYHHMNYL